MCVLAWHGVAATGDFAERGDGCLAMIARESNATRTCCRNAAENVHARAQVGYMNCEHRWILWCRVWLFRDIPNVSPWIPSWAETPAGHHFVRTLVVCRSDAARDGHPRSVRVLGRRICAAECATRGIGGPHAVQLGRRSRSRTANECREGVHGAVRARGQRHPCRSDSSDIWLHHVRE